MGKQWLNSRKRSRLYSTTPSTRRWRVTVGYIELIDVKDNTVYIQMSGGCQGCGAADVTLKAGIERMIKEEIPEVREILDVTDHAAGQNPYYSPSKG